MKTKTLVFCMVGGCWVLACGSEPPPDEPPESSAPEDEVVVIATADAVTHAATAAASAAGGAASAATTSSGMSGQSSDRTSGVGSASAGGASSISTGATTASTVGDSTTAGIAGAAGASCGGAEAGSGTTGERDPGAASTSPDTSGVSGGTPGGDSGAETNTTGEPLPPPPVPLGTVLITEYVEGGDNKAIEISNVSDDTVSLSECRLETYFNGSLESTSGVDLEIELAPQNSYVLCKSTAGATLSSICDRATGSINFNGDDALVLRCNDAVHDSFGQLGFDPGDAWRSTPSTGDGASPTYGTADYVLRRRCGALPRTDPTSAFEGALDEDWVAVWDFEETADPAFAGLGSADCAAGSDPGSTGGAGGVASE